MSRVWLMPGQTNTVGCQRGPQTASPESNLKIPEAEGGAGAGGDYHTQIACCGTLYAKDTFLNKRQFMQN